MKRILLTGLLLHSLSGCYTLTLQSEQHEVPVALNCNSTGPRRHFRHEYYQWYLLGILPYDFWNTLSSDSRGLTAHQYIDFSLRREKVSTGQVCNLNVITDRDLAGWFYSLLVTAIPFAGGLLGQNMHIVVEGDILMNAEQTPEQPKQ